MKSCKESRAKGTNGKQPEKAKIDNNNENMNCEKYTKKCTCQSKKNIQPKK